VLSRVEPGGLICAATNGHDPKTDLRYIWSFEFGILGSNCWDCSDLEALIELVSQGRIKPALDRVRPLAELATSRTDLIERRVVGKATLIH
jgi:D-arabinose 1-dehydrogenase-like Zn-dependent alcohol dehydrogenase